MRDKEEQNEARFEPLSKCAAWLNSDSDRFILSEKARQDLHQLYKEHEIRESDLKILDDAFEEEIRLFMKKNAVQESAPTSGKRKELLIHLKESGSAFQKALDEATEHLEMRSLLRSRMTSIRRLKPLLAHVLSGLPEDFKPRKGRPVTLTAFFSLTKGVAKILEYRRVPRKDYINGPFVEFLQFALKQAEINVDKETIRGYIKKAFHLPPPMPRS